MKPYFETSLGKLYQGNVIEVLDGMEAGSCQMCVTSPPYWGLRDYGLPPQIWLDLSDTTFHTSAWDCKHEWGDESKGTQRIRNGAEGGLHEGRDTNKMADNITLNPSQGQFCIHCNTWRGSLGLEPDPDLFISHMVQVFRSVWKVLRDDGCLWVNMGDSYATQNPIGNRTGMGKSGLNCFKDDYIPPVHQKDTCSSGQKRSLGGLKPKDLIGIPWRLALALQADGWTLRSAMPWVKRSAMPESVTDRPASALEYVFLFSKKAKYYFDMQAIRIDTDAIKGYTARHENIYRKAKSEQAESNSEIQRQCSRKSETKGIQTIGSGESIVQQMAKVEKREDVHGQAQQNTQTQSSFNKIHQNREVLRDPQEVSTDKKRTREPFERDTQKKGEPKRMHKHIDSGRMGECKTQTELPVCNMQETESSNQGSPDTIKQGGAPCSGEHTSPLPLMQRSEGKQNRKVRSPAGWKTGKGSHGTIHEDGREQELTYNEVPSGRNFRNTDLFYQSIDPPHGAIFCGDELVGLDVNPQAMKEAHFACVDSETECLTIGGWRRYHELSEGQPIFSYNMETQKLEIQPIQKIETYEYKGNLVSVFGRSSNMLLTPNHRCVIQRRNNRKGGMYPPVIVRADKIKRGMKFPVAAELSDTGLLEPNEPVEFYELLGWVSSEGGYKDTGGIEVYQSQKANPQHVKRLNELSIFFGSDIKVDSWDSGEHGVQMTYRITRNLRKKIRFCLPDKNRIPEHFLTLPSKYIKAFLRGFVGGDGHVRPDERISIIQKAKQPLDIIQGMYIRLNKSCILSQRGNGIWTAFVTNANSRYFKNANSSLIKHDYAYHGIVWCPVVKNGTWVARRGGRPFITGNTFPEKLVLPLILAGTSERGCCPECGKAWERVLEKIGERQVRWSATNTGPYRERTHQIESKTIGWKPGCSHYPKVEGWMEYITIEKKDHPTPEEIEENHIISLVRLQLLDLWKTMETIPCTVMDIFSGAGTVALVCEKHGRKWAAVELSEDYCEMSRARVEKYVNGTDFEAKVESEQSEKIDPLFS